jgi:hypothetical protein
MLARGELSPGDPVRYGTGGPWIAAADALRAAGVPGATSADAAARLLAEYGLPRGPAAPGRAAPFVGLTRLSESVGGAAARLAAPLLDRRVVAAATLAAGVVLLLRAAPAPGLSPREALARLEAIAAEAEDLRSRTAPDDEWDRFSGPASAEARRIADEMDAAELRCQQPGVWNWLTPDRETTRVARRSLTVAARYGLPEVVAARNGPPPKSHLEVTEVNLAEAAAWLDGINPATGRRWTGAVLAAEGAAPTAEPAGRETAAGLWVAAADAVLLVAGIVWWGRRRTGRA